LGIRVLDLLHQVVELVQNLIHSRGGGRAHVVAVMFRLVVVVLPPVLQELR
jgi:hypothetical protein